MNFFFPLFIYLICLFVSLEKLLYYPKVQKIIIHKNKKKNEASIVFTYRKNTCSYKKTEGNAYLCINPIDKVNLIKFLCRLTTNYYISYNDYHFSFSLKKIFKKFFRHIQFDITMIYIGAARIVIKSCSLVTAITNSIVVITKLNCFIFYYFFSV